MRSVQAASRQCIAPSRTFAASPFSAVRPVAAIRQLAPAQRWYSSEKVSEDQNSESNKEQAELLGAEDKGKLDAAAEDPVKKELETKKKELLDVTVRS